MLEVTSRIPEFSTEQLRAAPPVDYETFPEPETLSLPQSTLEVQELARRITEGVAAPVDRVQAIISYIEENTTYTLLEEPTPPGEDAAAFYLFRTRRGACDLAATATAVMCRAVGVPARVAVGYNEGEPMEGGGWLLRQDHAHMWVEAFFPGYGWVPFDPAPPLGDIRDSAFDLAMYRLRMLFSGIGGGGLDAVLLVAVVILTLAMAAYAGAGWLRAWLRRRARLRRTLDASPEAAVALVYTRAAALLEKRGWGREPWMTPREYLAALRRRWEGLSHGSAPALGLELVRRMETLTDCYERSQYAGEVSEETLRSARAALHELERLVPRKRAEEPSPPSVAAQPAAGTA
jgi:hypothetical protein